MELQMELGKRMELHVMELFQMELEAKILQMELEMELFQMELENTIGWKQEDYDLEDYQMQLGEDDEYESDINTL